MQPAVANNSNLRRRILILSQNGSVPPDRRAWQQATALSANGYIVSIICPKGPDTVAAHEKKDGIDIYRHPPASQYKSALGYLLTWCGVLIWQFMIAGRIFLTGGIDALHIINPPDSVFLVGSFFKTFFNKKLVLDYNASAPSIYARRFRRRDGLHSFLTKLERMALRGADIIIAASASAREAVMERGQMHADRIFIAGNGLDAERITMLGAAAPPKKERTFVIGCSYNKEQINSVPNLIEIARIVSQEKKRKGIRFMLMGTIADIEAVKKLAAQQGVTDILELAGMLPDEEATKSLRRTDICVSCEEQNPLYAFTPSPEILEYMALGKPIVQFDTTENRAATGDASVYAEPGDVQDMADKIIALCDDQGTRKVMADAAQARIRTDFNWSLEAPKLLAAYDALFKQTT